MNHKEQKECCEETLREAEKAGIIFGVREGNAFKEMSAKEVLATLTAQLKGNEKEV